MISEIYYVLAFMILHTEKGIKNVIIKTLLLHYILQEKGYAYFVMKTGSFLSSIVYGSE